MFHKILIANRGEIACRIIKTAKSMGIHTVAIYSKIDEDSLHVRSADSAYYVGTAPAKDSYLNSPRIIQIAKECGAEAIHPGYGFLSENLEFVKACKETNLVFIGPSLAAMQIMGSKQLTKQLLEQSNIPLIPGYHGVDQATETLRAAAKKIGFPILIKAANGGGGKGMRRVNEEADFIHALAAAKREAMASFAEDSMILEKLLVQVRHIEVQIMADNHGNVVHLFERDCSLQRRYQKIIEEAPAPNLSASLRQKLAAAACKLAASIQYSGAGTVEFLVDAEDRFYFMEMNTRLQVEHPVTELITGLDLVAWQLKIAANEPLPLPQDKIQARGHALECRIYAEDPYREFIPSMGQIDFLQEPNPATYIRLDTSIQTASVISQYYDPLIAKLIAWGNNREEALLRLEQALGNYLIGGVKTNIAFLTAICQKKSFRQAKVTTDFLNREKIKLPKAGKKIALLMALSFDYLKRVQAIKDPLLQESFAWQAQTLGYWIERYQDETEVLVALVKPINQNQFEVEFKGEKHLIQAELNLDQLCILINKQRHQVTINNQKHSLTFYTAQGPLSLERFAWHIPVGHTKTPEESLYAPMSATVVAVLKNIGDRVKAGELLMVIEAMKMEQNIYAPSDGLLLDIFYAVGSQVNEGAKLISLDETNSILNKR